jgi:hypothetical protein
MRSIVQRKLNQKNFGIQRLFQIHIRNIEETKKEKKENMVVVRKWEFLEPMMDKIKEIEEKNRLRDWRRQNHDEVKKNIVQAKKSKEIATQA